MRRLQEPEIRCKVPGEGQMSDMMPQTVIGGLARAPCVQCSVRVVGCHCSCERYTEYRRQCDCIRQARERIRIADSASIEGKIHTAKAFRFQIKMGGRY